MPANDIITAQDLYPGNTRRDRITDWGLGDNPTGLDDYLDVYENPGPIHHTRIKFGRTPTGSNADIQYPTITITDDGSTGHAAQLLYTFPAGVINILAVTPNMTMTVNGSWTVTTPQLALGTTACTSSTLATTQVNIVPATTITLTSRAGPFAVANAITAFTSTSGQTATTTYSTIAGTATYNSADINRMATVLEEVVSRLNRGNRAIALDGSSSAVTMYLNMGVASDPGASGNSFYLGGTLDLLWNNFGDV